MPEFGLSRQLDAAPSDSQGVLGLLLVGLILLCHKNGRMPPELEQMAVHALVLSGGGWPTFEELERCADALQADPRGPCKDGGVFLRKALCGYREASEAGDDYAFADVIHWAIGTLEEVACQAPGVKAKTLGGALKELEALGVLSSADRRWLEETYGLRNETRGIGHGAGGAPEYVATFVLFNVQVGLSTLMPLLGFPHQD